MQTITLKVEELKTGQIVFEITRSDGGSLHEDTLCRGAQAALASYVNQMAHRAMLAGCTVAESSSRDLLLPNEAISQPGNLAPQHDQ